MNFSDAICKHAPTLTETGNVARYLADPTCAAYDRLSAAEKAMANDVAPIQGATESFTLTLTDNAILLFAHYADDAGNWNGTPLVGRDGNVSLLGDKEDRGLLTHLKRAGLVTTFKQDGCQWLSFTSKGVQFAASLGYTVRW